MNLIEIPDIIPDWLGLGKDIYVNDNGHATIITVYDAVDVLFICIFLFILSLLVAYIFNAVDRRKNPEIRAWSKYTVMFMFSACAAITFGSSLIGAIITIIK
jgi:Kef-type K+ transport system membrane component KefB